MKRIINVQTGQIKTGQGEVMLKSTALGSCIAIAACDRQKKIGSLAHIMLPGRAPQNKKEEEKIKYVCNAIDEIIRLMTELGSQVDRIEAVVVGGGNVLKRKDDTICHDNINSVIKCLQKNKIKINAQALGGNKRKSISFDVAKSIICYTEGDEPEKLLWKAF